MFLYSFVHVITVLTVAFFIFGTKEHITDALQQIGDNMLLGFKSNLDNAIISEIQNTVISTTHSHETISNEQKARLTELMFVVDGSQKEVYSERYQEITTIHNSGKKRIESNGEKLKKEYNSLYEDRKEKFTDELSKFKKISHSSSFFFALISFIFLLISCFFGWLIHEHVKLTIFAFPLLIFDLSVVFIFYFFYKYISTFEAEKKDINFLLSSYFFSILVSFNFAFLLMFLLLPNIVCSFNYKIEWYPVFFICCFLLCVFLWFVLYKLKYNSKCTFNDFIKTNKKILFFFLITSVLYSVILMYHFQLMVYLSNLIDVACGSAVLILLSPWIICFYLMVKKNSKFINNLNSSTKEFEEKIKKSFEAIIQETSNKYENLKKE